MSKVGRPTNYNKTIATRICELVATHDCGIGKLCDMYDELPWKQTIRLWQLKHPEFNEQYMKAKAFQVNNLAEDILEIADDSSGDIKMDKDGNECLNSEFVARSRIRIDTRKWLASKLAPKIYGDKKIDETVTNNDALNKIKELVSDLNKNNPSDV
jgi:hypothetical protein